MNLRNPGVRKLGSSSPRTGRRVSPREALAWGAKSKIVSKIPGIPNKSYFKALF